VEAVIVLVIVFVPGYIFLQFTKQSVAFISKEIDARYFFSLIVWGGLIHAVGAYWTLQIIDWYNQGTLREHPAFVIIWALILLVATPIAFGLLASWLITVGWVDSWFLRPIKQDYLSRIPSAWNYAILTGAAFVRVHLNDGTVIGGFYGTKSLADHDIEKDIFLEAVYNLDENGDFIDEVPATAGIWVPRSSIAYILFFRGPNNTPDTNGTARRNDQ
jgi:hypothetical protein